MNCCPECFSIRLYKRKGSIATRDKKHKYKCVACGHVFDYPDQTERGSGATNATHGLARKLIEMDKDDL